MALYAFSIEGSDWSLFLIDQSQLHLQLFYNLNQCGDHRKHRVITSCKNIAVSTRYTEDYEQILSHSNRGREMAKREEVLGFKPQKELVYSRLLPYAGRLDEDSNVQLGEIKANLGRAVLLKDFRPGCLHWAHRLSDYICLYGRKFSKEDHVSFIKIFYELVVTPDSELTLVQIYAQILVALLKKRELISPQELQLEWRPLYILYERVAYSQYEPHNLILFPGRSHGVNSLDVLSLMQDLNLQQKWTSIMANLDGKRSIISTLKSLIRLCRPYFPLAATSEMLDEWKQLLCPFDVTVLRALNYLELFLPTLLPPEHHDKGFKLWFADVMDLWRLAHNCPTWEHTLIWLVSRLAMDTIGHIDWEPHIPMIFTKLLRSFNLPVGSCLLQIGRMGNAFEVTSAVNFVIAMLGGGSSCQQNLTKLFKAIESYYHPSNNGRWNIKLQRMLYKLPASLVNRLHKERYKKPSWEPSIVPSHRLTDDDVDEFVESIKACVLLAMFSKTGSLYSANAMQYLSILKPKSVIPSLLERLYPALETLTEPHRLIATMHCFVSVSRSLVRGGDNFPEGPAHVIPLLLCSLPGIDPNDFKKCMVTFQFIFAFVTLVPLVDCSSAVGCEKLSLTEREEELCLATREFEDFLLQFMDRCFALIENSSLEHTTRLDRDTEKMNSEEGMLTVVLTSTFTAMLMQCSTEIYQLALSKLQTFICGRVLETKVSGRLAANMCRAASKVKPDLALKAFLPQICRTILSLTAAEEVLKEEMLDTELLFSMLLLSEIVRCNGQELLNYKDLLVQVLDRTLHLTSKPGYLLSHAVLRHILKALTLVAPVEFRSTTENFDQPMSDYLPIRDWGKSGDVNELHLKWHLPNDDEKAWVRELLLTFLVPELQKLEKVAEKELTMTREERQRSLSIVLDFILGAGAVLPLWQEDSIKLVESRVTLKYTPHTFSMDSEGLKLEDGGHVRNEIARVINKLLEFVLSTSEDDTKSLFQIIQIYQQLLFYLGINKEDFEARWKSFHFAKKSMENKLLGKKQHIRSLLIDRTQMQHEVMCVLERVQTIYTPFHEQLMSNLLLLSTSHYSEVRAKAQVILNRAFQVFTFSYTRFITKIETLLCNDDSITHEQFKGALYVILGSKTRSFLTKHNWKALNVLWPAVIKAQHSEKPSIIKLMDEMSEQVQRNLETLALEWKSTEKCSENAKLMWNNSLPKCSLSIPSDDELKLADDELKAKNAECLSLYHNLIEKIVNLISNGTLRWRHNYLGLVLLSLLMRHDVPLPANAVKIFAQNLIHETLSVRKLSINTIAAILKQQKKPHTKVEINPYSVDESGIIDKTLEKREKDEKVPPGHRPDNEWLQYHYKYRPLTKEEWEKRVFVNKTHVGYYCWPKATLVYSPLSEQPPVTRQLSDLTPEEATLFEFFQHETNIRQWISFLSLEDRKGKDKFDAKRFVLFKGLFRNYGNTFLSLFHPHLERLVSESQESSQRCAAEIIAGLVRGSKHWPFEMVEVMREMLVPILRTALRKVTVETVGDWGTCIATASESGDPNRLHWLMELLMEEPMRAAEGSFIESSRLYVLQGGIAQQEWRVSELLHRLLDYLKPYLTHPFQNVRVRIGSVLTNIFLMDVNLPNSLPNKCPRRSEFVDEVLPRLAILESETNASSTSDLDNAASNSLIIDERKTALALMKTVCKWLIGNVTRAMYTAPPEFFRFLPMLCQMESNDNDEELKQDCMLAIACLGQAYLTPANIEVAIASVVQITTSSSWRARASSLSYLQVMVFCNLFQILKSTELVAQIRLVILRLLEDDRVEVREMAGVTLGGFFHCEFIKFNKELLKIFKTKCSKKLVVRDRRTPILPEKVIQCHAGILGLCAYVNANPYDVPEEIPDILMILGDHLNDPQPIPLTIKKTLSNFRRTHHDNWRDHKLKFSDDQLTVLTDLLVSPSYYA